MWRIVTIFYLWILSQNRAISKGFLNADLNILDSFDKGFILSTVVTFFITLILLLLLIKRLSISRKLLKEKEAALNMIEVQKATLELRDKSLTDSLIYAQRIQEALLPSEEYFRSHIRESFIYYKPKDILSGDFYWIGDKGDKIFVVAADCTGHGVPGALMSIIGIEILNKAINEDGFENPSEILAVMNKGLEKMFSSEKNIGTIIRDGMDIGLCIIDMKTRSVEYSGAFFSLYLIRNNNLIELKGDKIIIGMNPEGLPYTNNKIALTEDDMLYLFSDGYADQFGGSENRKFMYRRFRYLLLTIHNFPIDDQKTILEDNMSTWMGRNPQVDDIMVIGFRPIPRNS